MVAYTAHSLVDPRVNPARAAEDIVFVRDGFAFWAFILPAIWFLVHRMWLPLLGYLVVSIAFGLGLEALGLPDETIFPAALLLGLLIGFEANDLRRWSLERKGWLAFDVGSGRNREEAERAVFERLVSAGPVDPLSIPRPPGTHPARTARTQATRGSGIVGLFPDPKS